MSRSNRFTAFLEREAAGYNAPPEIHADSTWKVVEEGLADSAAAFSGATGGLGEAGAPAGARAAGGAPRHAPGYHAPPPPPRDEMWARIEASRALRSASAVEGARTNAAHRRRPLERAWFRRRATAGWATALAAAASLVLWIALENAAGPPAPGGVEIAAPAAAPAVRSESVEPGAATEQPPDNMAEVAEPVGELEGVLAGVARPPANEADDAIGVSVDRTVAAAPGTGVAVLSDLTPGADDSGRTRHLDRAATLLTAFRIDRRTPASEMELASWARELLVETRGFLDMPIARTPLQQALLEDLELVLLQISRLGPGVPEFEWQLARESMQWKGTLMRVRAASAAGAP